MSGKKRGLSVDEKRKIVLELVQSNKSVWILKDIEKVCLKF